MKMRAALGAVAIIAVIGVVMPLSAATRRSDRAAAPRAIQPTPPAAVRETLSKAFASGVSDIQSPNAICYRPASATGDCYIHWTDISVSAPASANVVSMTVEIDSRLRAYHSGFFQTTMYIPGDMVDPGYRVACGAPGSGGIPDFGRVYSYTLRARYTDASTSTNTGTALCPADIVPAFLPLVLR